MAELYTANQIALEIYALVFALGSQKKAAAKIGISPQYLNDIIHGRREVSPQVAEFFGYTRLCLFSKKEEPAP